MEEMCRLIEIRRSKRMFCFSGVGYLAQHLATIVDTFDHFSTFAHPFQYLLDWEDVRYVSTTEIHNVMSQFAFHFIRLNSKDEHIQKHSTNRKHTMLTPRGISKIHNQPRASEPVSNSSWKALILLGQITTLSHYYQYHILVAINKDKLYKNSKNFCFLYTHYLVRLFSK